jgi:hypothetical protein
MVGKRLPAQTALISHESAPELVESRERRHAMLSRLIALAILVSVAVLSSASRPQAAPPSPPVGANTLLPGTLIDSGNDARYTQFLPAAVQAAIRYGLKVRVVPTQRLDWSAGFTKATEKYSSQVGLDQEDDITNYVAGAPFPTVDVSDPKAAVKIAYNWHMGPFMPDDFSLAPWGSFAYSSEESNNIQPEEDYNYVCDQFTFLRFAHRTEVDPRPTFGSNSQGYEWKARCNEWTANPAGDLGEGSGIWLRYLDPHRGDEFYGFDSETRRVRRSASASIAVNEACRSCHQPYWAYALPKTEAYQYRLLGTTPLLACMTASEEPAGLKQQSTSLTLLEEPFALRNAYILEMTPKAAGFANLRGLVFVDTEAYVWLAAEFFASSERTAVAVPLWRSHPSPAGGNLFDLAGEFYVPSRQPAISARAEHSANDTRNGVTSPNYPHWFFRTLRPAREDFDQKINSGEVGEGIFNPQALAR